MTTRTATLTLSPFDGVETYATVSPLYDEDTLEVSFAAQTFECQLTLSLTHSGGYPDARRIYVLRDGSSAIIFQGEQGALAHRFFVGNPAVRGCGAPLTASGSYVLTVTSATPTQGRRIDCFLSLSWTLNFRR
jgi:hypothetical protein